MKAFFDLEKKVSLEILPSITETLNTVDDKLSITQRDIDVCEKVASSVEALKEAIQGEICKLTFHNFNYLSTYAQL
jgi:hypothetical protein